jgi:NADH:ubiquinone reductase (H+-translocating)
VLQWPPIDVMWSTGVPRVPVTAVSRRERCAVGGNIAPTFRDLFRSQRNTGAYSPGVGGIDLERPAVACRLLDRTSELAFDGLIVATGSAQSHFGRDERPPRPGLKTRDDAPEVRGRIFGAFELAEPEKDAARQAG